MIQRLFKVKSALLAIPILGGVAMAGTPGYADGPGIYIVGAAAIGDYAMWVSNSAGKQLEVALKPHQKIHVLSIERSGPGRPALVKFTTSTIPACTSSPCSTFDENSSLKLMTLDDIPAHHQEVVDARETLLAATITCPDKIEKSQVEITQHSPPSITVAEQNRKFFKTPSEVENYIVTRGGKGEQYTDENQKWVFATEASFGIPSQYLACLVLRETMWKPGLKNSAEAAGLTQLRPGAIDTINHVIQFDKVTSEAKRIQWLKEEEETLRMLNSNQAITQRQHDDFSFINVELQTEAIENDWKHYIELIRLQRNHSGFNESDAFSAPESLGGAAVYLKFENLLLSTISTGSPAESLDNPDMLGVLAFSYNAGPQPALQIIAAYIKDHPSMEGSKEVSKESPKENTKHWLQAMTSCSWITSHFKNLDVLFHVGKGQGYAKMLQAINYVKAIRTCMEAGKTAPMPASDEACGK